MRARQVLSEIATLDEKIAELRDRFEGCPADERLAVLDEVFSGLLASTGEADPPPLALGRCVDLIERLVDESAGELLARGLGHANPDIRLLCGEMLVMLADDGGTALLRGAVETALAGTAPLAEEMPFVLAEVEDPEAPRIIERFLEHSDAEVVAAAIEALIELGDPASLPAIERLVDDKRAISVGDEAPEEGGWALGQLAQDAIDSFDVEEE